MTSKEAKIKLYHYCAYQERCHQEVEEKLRSLGVNEDEAADIIHHLITEGFLNEDRYAKTFVNGKFRQKQWGRLKIIRALEEKDISKHCIKSGLAEITTEEYSQTLFKLLEKKAALTEAPNIYSLRDKLSKYAMAKGFEPEIVWAHLKQLLPDQR